MFEKYLGFPEPRCGQIHVHQLENQPPKPGKPFEKNIGFTASLSYPKQSMYDLFTFASHRNSPHVGKYTSLMGRGCLGTFSLLDNKKLFTLQVWPDGAYYKAIF